ncbi:MAG: basic amino acid ABC transporter substrate-binding protein [Lachnospiraceae bacterium]|nr:basic amino acid ABC transporter substrate-binding protein [Lachnospiraceae bacterium]
MKKTVMLFVLSAAIVFAGCGNSGSASDESKATADSAADGSETQSDDAFVGSEALADGVLNVGTNAEFPPFEFVGDDGEPDGFDIALIKAIGEELGVAVEVENMEFNSLVASIGSKIDVAIAGMTITEERQNSVDFSDSYYEAVQYVLVPADSDIAGIADLEGKTIGAQLGTTGDFLIEDIADATASQYNKGVDAVNDLVNGRLDAVIIDKNPAMVFAEKFEGEIKAIDGADFAFEPENYAIAVPKGDEALVSIINNALATIKEDGTFDQLVSEYIEN